jgi:hypothetical protein
VTVTQPAPTVSLTASPTSITSGQTSTLSWSSTNATSCTASGAWSGDRVTSGTDLAGPSSTQTYTLTCTGAGGSASDSATVTVTQPTFSNGDRVQVTEDSVNVRNDPTTSGTIVGTKNAGTLGVVIGGPAFANGFIWWQVDFDYDTVVDGWMSEDFLVKFTCSVVYGGAAAVACASGSAG